MISAQRAADYLTQYIETYKQEYKRSTSPAPQGGGYPGLQISPYLYSHHLCCYLAKDGAVIADFSWRPSYQWHIAGGPALLVDFPDTRTPPEIVELLKREGIWGKPIGMYRIVAQEGIPDEVWHGELGRPVETVERLLDHTKIIVTAYNLTWSALIQRLTYGALCLILDIRLGSEKSDFWTPHVIRDLGFVTADRKHKRYFHYLELLPHVDEAAWDARSIAIRVQADVRRDFAVTFSTGWQPGGTISFGKVNTWVEHFYDRLSTLKQVIRQFRVLLDENPGSDEAVFHTFLETHSILLDVYGEAISKPRFVYPTGESPLGKQYVEPDFIIRYPGGSYRLIELERPSKPVATKAGQTRSEVSQAAFQIAEWITYIRNHYEMLKPTFPGIAVNHTTMIVMSRSTQESFGAGRDIKRYMELVKAQYAVDEILTYDDLLRRAEQAYIQLSTLAPNRQILS